MTAFQKARAAALIVPAALMIGALGSQYIGGLYPCEMCYWQRWPHDLAIVLALFAFGFRNRGVDRILVGLAAVAILTSGAIGVFHAGVEYKWWEGLTACAVTVGSDVTLDSILRAPIVACDRPQWEFAGISLAGFNAIISTLAGVVILGLLAVKEKAHEIG
jgi:disulfide bond formation protein DsbB